MGAVYRARDPRLDREVAIKIVRLEQFSDPDQREHLVKRFETEARAAARLKHAHIVAVHDFGEEQGQAFLVMELVAGKNLAEIQKLQNGKPLSVAQVMRILRECAGALDHAHGLGVVHRDVKPANLMLQRDGSLKLTDFGIARISTLSGVTIPGQTLGTPHYMAPEAVDPREDRPADGRSDQFSLAVMAYELIAGRKPFEGDSLATLSLRIVRDDPPKIELQPSENAEELNRIFDRALAKKAADRYPSCRTMVVELEAACRGIQEFPAGPEKPATKVFTRDRTPTDDMETVASGGNAAPRAEAETVVSRVAEAALAGDSVLGRGDSIDLRPQARGNGEKQLPAPLKAEALPELKPQTAPPITGTRPLPIAWIAGGLAVVLFGVGAIWMTNGNGSTQNPEQAKVVTKIPETPAGMVVVKAGVARLGADRLETEVPAFFIDRTEVTNQSWLEFCKATGRDGHEWAQLDPRLPVVNVSFDEASEYAVWAGKRLPSPMEWEKAARGESGQAFPWGAEFAEGAANLLPVPLKGQAARLEPADAHGDRKGPYGTLNQVGNASEWVARKVVPSDRAFGFLSQALRALAPPLTQTEPYYETRGGSFQIMVPPDQIPSLLWDYSPMPARARVGDVGFRCVKDF
jgi:formylglycine-generating enzyme required for sulfatase activity/tRNA A-37 threonylcarbamoyl transferase component Bud32